MRPLALSSQNHSHQNTLNSSSYLEITQLLKIGKQALISLCGSIWKHPFCIIAFTFASGKNLYPLYGWKGFSLSTRPRDAAVGYLWRSQFKSSLCMSEELYAKVEAVSPDTLSRNCSYQTCSSDVSNSCRVVCANRIFMSKALLIREVQCARVVRTSQRVDGMLKL